MMGRRLGWGLGVVVASACGGSEGPVEPSEVLLRQRVEVTSSALDVTLPQGTLPQPEPFYRLELAKQVDGSLELLHLSLVITDHAPLSPFAADYMLVSRAANGNVVDAVPVRFEATGHTSSLEDGEFVHEDSVLETPVTSALLPASAGVASLECWRAT